MGKIKYILIALIIVPFSSYSQIQGPSQPEFTNFSSINNQEIVNENTGDLNYGIPILTIPGENDFNYTLKLSYNSDFGPDDEASWVGWGWNLNIGSITRIKNGFPDDFNNVDVTYYNKRPDNVSINLTLPVGAEIYSIHSGVEIQQNFHYNSLNGYYLSSGFGLSAYKGIGNLNFGFDKSGNLSGSYSFDLSPSIIFSELTEHDLLQTLNLEYQIPLVSRMVAYGMANYNLLQGSFPNTNFNSVPTSLSGYLTKIKTLRFTTRPDVFPKVGVDVGISATHITTEYIEEDTKKAYGYMYSTYANAKIESFIKDNNYKDLYNEKIKMDYTLDRNNPFTKRDYYLSIPMSNPDEFIVQAEGLSGGFRYQFRKPIKFYPEAQNNIVSNASLGGSYNYAAFPVEYGIGFQTSFGIHGRNQIDPLVDLNEDEDYNYGSFVFHNDKSLNKSFDPLLSRVNINNDEFDFTTLNLDYKSEERPSNFIQYSTIGSRKFNKTLKFNNFGEYKDLITEFKITNTDGIKYTFGQPVFSRNESSISYGMEEDKSSKVENNFFYPYRISEKEVNQKYGSSASHPYANSFLLTEIHDSNYSDADNDGTSIDDAGNYIKFEYSKISGFPIDFKNNRFLGIDLTEKINGNDKKNEWNEWRIPYNGYNFSKNELSRVEDDLFSFSEGEKELFYPKIIKTKTHIAIFITNKTNIDPENDKTGQEQFSLYLNGFEVTPDSKIYHLIKGSNKEREDNLPANNKNNNIENSLLNLKLKKFEKNPYRKLEKILLFSIDRESELSKDKEIIPSSSSMFITKKPVYYVKELIQVVNLETDYELRKQTINSAVNSSNLEREGKLTLKKVWSDYKDVVEPKIAPYEFEYSYPIPSEADYPSEFTYLENYGNSLNQNPDYSIYQTNSWNYNQTINENNFNELNYSVSQNNNNTFDPAAWRLKRIKTPSQGEIHLQYDEKDYSSVQNRIPMIMAKLESYDDNGGSGPFRYTIDLSDYYSEVTSSVITKLRNEFASNLIGGKQKKIYGKFLYNYLDSDQTNINDCKSEYLDGFVNVQDIVINPLQNDRIDIILNSDYFRDICLDLYKNTKNGLDCQTGNKTVFGPVIDAFNIIINNIKNISWGLIDYNSCLEINPSQSYFRIPLFNKDKLSGGPRVKRVLFFDKFNKEIEKDELNQYSPETSLYGSEYIYKERGGFSSGVASNEPDRLGMENALLDILDLRQSQTATQDFINGVEKDQNYGNLAKHILPSAKINYSRIIKQRIGIEDENGNSNSFDGFSISEFYTYKDFPYDYKYGITNSEGQKINSINHTNLQKEEYTLPMIPNPFLTIDYATFTASQGFLFIKNNINGLFKKKSIFNGNYLDSDSWYLKYSKELVYSSPGECLPLFKGFNYDTENEQQPLNVISSVPGIEIESVTETKNIIEKSNILTGYVDLDWLFSFIPPTTFFLPSGYGSLNVNYRKLSTSVNNTVVSFSPTLKSIKETKDGVVNLVENLMFDHKTGNPVLTRNSDEYDKAFLENSLPNDGGIYSYNFPASYFYPTFDKASHGATAYGVSSTWDIVSLPRAYMELIGHADGFDYVILRGNKDPNKSIFYLTGDKVEIKILFTGVEDGDREVIILKGIIHSVNEDNIRVQLSEKGNYPYDKVPGAHPIAAKLIKWDSQRNNRLNEIADKIVIYGSDEYFQVCDNTLPDHFDVNYLYANQNSSFSEGQSQISGLASNINGKIQEKITNNNYSESLINLDTFNLEIRDIVSGYENISDSSKVQYSLELDSTFDLQLPFDSVLVNLRINQKNELGVSDTLYNHSLVDELNTLLNDLWIKDISTLVNEESLFYNCMSNDSTGGAIDNYFIGVLDSLESNSINLLTQIKEEYFYVFNSDSSKNVLTTGEDILTSLDSNNNLFISYRDLDSNFRLNEGRISYLANNEIKFLKDTNNNYFNLGHIKYVKPNQLLASSVLSFDNDCRDTSLLDISFIQSEWDTTFITLPGTKLNQEKIYFPQNDSLFNYLNNYSSFTSNFGYFSIDGTGMLNYNTIGSDYGYSDSTQTPIMSIFLIDSTKYQDVTEYSFFVNPSNPITSVVVDTNQGSSLLISNPINIEQTDKVRLPKWRYPKYPKIKADNVIYANSKTFSEPKINHDYKNLRPHTCCDDLQHKFINYENRNYYYNIERNYGNTLTYNNGLFNNFVLFNHFNLNDNSFNWKEILIQDVDQNNDLLELKDMNDVSSSQLVNSQGQPIAIFYDAKYEDVFFESFENTEIATGSQATSSASHNGENSIKLLPLPSANSYDLIKTDEDGKGLKVTDQIIERGLNIKLWAKIDGTNIHSLQSNEFENPISIQYNIGTSPSIMTNMSKITQTGDWSLFESNIPSTQFTTALVGDDIEIDLLISPSSPSIQELYFDDVVLKPINSKSSCYVYNNSNSLLIATLDDNHFSARYQYNAKGELIRKIIETFEGVKTIADAQYNTPLVDRIETAPSSLQGVLEGSPFNLNKNNLRVSPSELINFENGLKPTEIGTKFDVLDIKINSDSSNVKFLEFIKQNSDDLLKNPIEIDSISQPSFKNIQLDSLDNKFQNDINNNKINLKNDFKIPEKDSINTKSELNKLRKGEEEK